jgi:recombination protein RecA
MAKKQNKVDLLSSLEEYIGDVEKEVTVIPTGVASIDVSLGIKGIPLGKFVEIYGPESVGKTTLALQIANQFLLHDERNVVYNDSEQALSSQLIDQSINPEVKDRFIVIQPGTLEKSLRACENAIKSGEVSLIVLDSIGSLAPEVVIDGDLEDRQVSILARIFTTFIQRNAQPVRQNKMTFLGINQVRDNIGGYMKTYNTPGGHAWRHILSVRIGLNYAAQIKKGEEKIGINTSFVIAKNKLAPPLKSASFPIIFGKGIDVTRDLILFSELIGIITRRGSYYVFQDTNLGLGLEKSIEFLENNKETLDKLREACYNSTSLMNFSSIIEENSEDEDIEF